MLRRGEWVERINQAYHETRRVAGGPRKTPLDYAAVLSERTGARIYLKCEHHQHTGSFKFRGALNKMLSLANEERLKGVIAASTGNHGLGVARAAEILGIDALIYVPHDASALKVAAIKRHGAEVRLVDGDCLVAERQARAYAATCRRVFISPYNDLDVIAGQGTLAREIDDQLVHLDALFVSVGGGGLIGGIGSYFKQQRPGVRMVGCWPENAPAMLRCIEAGAIVDVPESPTLSDATAGGVEPGSVTYPLCRDVIDAHVTVTESEIADAMRLLAETENWMVEGAAGVALAACLKTAHQYPGANLAVLLCGRNIAVDRFLSLFDRGNAPTD